MKINHRLTLLLTAILCIALLTACSAANGSNIQNGNDNKVTENGTITNYTGTSINSSGAPVEALTTSLAEDDYYFSWKDQSYTTIDLNQGATEISKSGIYEITGTLKDGSLIVNIDKSADKGTVFLVLNAAELFSTISAPLYIKEAKKVVLLLEDGTSNTIYQGSNVIVDESGDPTAAIYSKADLTITGSGTLKVTSDFNDGITSKDILVITDGNIQIKAKEDGIVGKDALIIQKANITIDAGKDGMRSTNETTADMGNIIIEDGTFNITASNDGIQAFGILQIHQGNFTILSGGGYTEALLSAKAAASGDMGRRPNQNTVSTTADSESMKGLKSDSGILLNGGHFILSSADDAIHSNGDILINGGTFTINTGDDGIHSDTLVTINGGDITIENAYEGIEGIYITINDGQININVMDDGINVNAGTGLLTINGGTVYIKAEGDGLDSNNAIVMTGGSVNVNGPLGNMNGAIDYDRSFVISGGSLIAAGSSGMVQTPDANSQQPSLLVYYSSVQPAGKSIVLKDNTGNEIAVFTPVKNYSSVVISTPAMKTGQSYTLYSESTKLTDVALSTMVTAIDQSGSIVNMGRNAGGMGGIGGGLGGAGRPNMGNPGIPGGSNDQNMGTPRGQNRNPGNRNN